ncbi:cathepsin L-like proteinase [Diabrotica virgifera virgifera]|uniref:Cathepsin L-like proteinase n=1 Tax=Diabrotica virgifera virgifera TaxID=50390 RepID=A0ABM5KV41_DIAVI|nr:cathepsin L-like proteinase [Diabrotica virgifera virgifera]
MKFLILVATLAITANALSNHDQWAQFKVKHSKNYNTFREEQIRFQVFSSNLLKIAEHNARYEKGEETYFMAVNRFADLTSEEYEAMLGLQISSMSKPNITSSFVADPEEPAPDSIDWREKGAVTPVRNQHYPHQCGSCWAHSAAAALESHRFINENKLEVLSVQEIMDCSRDYGNAGCNGGWMDSALEYVKDHGICAESSYEYTAQNGDTCKTCEKVIHTFKEVVEVGPSEQLIKEAVGTVGPVTVAVDASKWQLYAGGIFDGNCGYTVNHGVLVVGYGQENNKDFWLIKNSHGAEFGENGYIRLARGKDLCNITFLINYPKF